MATETTSAPADPRSLSQLRPIERINPGMWAFGDFIADDGSEYQLWYRVETRLEGQHVLTGMRTVQIIGTATDGEGCNLHQRRGYGVESLTAAQGRKCGLTVPTGGEAS